MIIFKEITVNELKVGDIIVDYNGVTVSEKWLSEWHSSGFRNELITGIIEIEEDEDYDVPLYTFSTVDLDIAEHNYLQYEEDDGKDYYRDFGDMKVRIKIGEIKK